jgi:hypothetical protein
MRCSPLVARGEVSRLHRTSPSPIGRETGKTDWNRERVRGGSLFWAHLHQLLTCLHQHGLSRPAQGSSGLGHRTHWNTTKGIFLEPS